MVFFYYYGQRIWVQHYSYLYDYDYSPEFLLFCFSSFYLQRERIHPIKCLQCQCTKTNTTKRLKQVWGKGFNRIHMNICSKEITKHNLWHKASYDLLNIMLFMTWPVSKIVAVQVKLMSERFNHNRVLKETIEGPYSKSESDSGDKLFT